MSKPRPIPSSRVLATAPNETEPLSSYDSDENETLKGSLKGSLKGLTRHHMRSISSDDLGNVRETRSNKDKARRKTTEDKSDVAAVPKVPHQNVPCYPVQPYDHPDNGDPSTSAILRVSSSNDIVFVPDDALLPPPNVEPRASISPTQMGPHAMQRKQAARQKTRTAHRANKHIESGFYRHTSTPPSSPPKSGLGVDCSQAAETSQGSAAAVGRTPTSSNLHSAAAAQGLDKEAGLDFRPTAMAPGQVGDTGEAPDF